MNQTPEGKIIDVLLTEDWGGSNDQIAPFECLPLFLLAQNDLFTWLSQIAGIPDSKASHADHDHIVVVDEALSTSFWLNGSAWYTLAGDRPLIVL